MMLSSKLISASALLLAATTLSFIPNSAAVSQTVVAKDVKDVKDAKAVKADRGAVRFRFKAGEGPKRPVSVKLLKNHKATETAHKQARENTLAKLQAQEEAKKLNKTKLIKKPQ